MENGTIPLLRAEKQFDQFIFAQALSVSTADYLQPFPTVVIELPLDYTKKRVVPFDEGSHAPDFVIVRHEPKAGGVMVAMHMTSHQVMTRLLKLDLAWTLEE